jgi:hypothetical protein
MLEAGEIDGGRRKNHKNPIVRIAVRIVVTTLVFLFAFIVYQRLGREREMHDQRDR